jgi:hypothetical protein
MPKILIKETDLTSPGTPDGYANYSVLVVGFAGDDGDYLSEKPTVAADSNGVYEFTSANDFKKTIGLKAPAVSLQHDGVTATVYHYGNQMAYELLKMGYTVIYKVILDTEQLTDEATWEPFKDKANYDFRFITHGLLSSSDLTEPQRANSIRLDAVNKALEELERIALDAANSVPAQDANVEQELADKRNELYQTVAYNFDGFLAFDESTNTYGEQPYYQFHTFTEVDPDDASNQIEHIGAYEGVKAEKAYLESRLAGKVTKQTINTANRLIAELAHYNANAAGTSGRGDCVALIELDERYYIGVTDKPEVAIANATQEIELTHDNSKYCAMTVPSVIYKMEVEEAFGNNKKFPGAFHYLACFINSLKQGFAEWYAAAGYTRGVSSYTIDYTSVKLGEIAINALEPRNLVSGTEVNPKFACNFIANFRGSYYLWGNRTAFLLYNENNQKYGDLTASSFLNIRQLCTTLKKQLYIACRKFTFDPNSDTLWFNFVNAIRPTLEAMKADQGIRDYKILKVPTDRKATLKAKIRIIPIEAVEDFDLEVSLEDSFGETTAVVTE